MENHFRAKMRLAIFLAGFVILICAENLFAITATVNVRPLEPRESDTVVVTISTPLPNLCWRFDSSNVRISGNTTSFMVYITNTANCDQACLPVFFTHQSLDTLGTLPQGPHLVRVHVFSHFTCGNITVETVVEEPFVVGNVNCSPCNAGDANSDGSANIADITFLIARIFAGGTAPLCAIEADVNGDGRINLADVTAYIAFIFSNGNLGGCR